MLFATALGSVALALTAHQLKRRGRKRKLAGQAKEGQKTVGIPEALLKTGRPSSLKRGVQKPQQWKLCNCNSLVSGEVLSTSNTSCLWQVRLLAARVWAPALGAMTPWVEFPPWLPVNTQVPHTAWHLLVSYFFVCSPPQYLPSVCDVSISLWFALAQTRVPNSPNQSANPPTPWETEPVAEESGAVEDANAENLYLLGAFLEKPQKMSYSRTLRESWQV